MANLRQIKMSKREQLLCVIAVIALGFGYTKWVVLKKRAEIQSVETTKSTMRSSMASMNSVIEAIQQKRQPASTEGQASGTDLVPGYISTSANLSNLIRELTEEDPTQLYNVKKIQGKPVTSEKSSAEGKHYDLILYEVQLETSFLSVGRFVEKLENSKFILDIVSVEVNRMDSDLKRCTASIRLNSYIPKLKGT